MIRSRTGGLIVGLVALAAVLGTLLAVEYLRGEPRVAFGQGETVSSNYVLALMGVTTNDRTPLFIVDTKSQTILIYEYMVSTRQFFLRVARSYAGDRELQDNIFGVQNLYEGPSVRDVQNILRSRRP